MATALRQPITGAKLDASRTTWVKCDTLNMACPGCGRNEPIRKGKVGYYWTCRVCALRLFIHDLYALGIKADE